MAKCMYSSTCISWPLTQKWTTDSVFALPKTPRINVLSLSDTHWKTIFWLVGCENQVTSGLTYDVVHLFLGSNDRLFYTHFKSYFHFFTSPPQNKGIPVCLQLKQVYYSGTLCCRSLEGWCVFSKKSENMYMYGSSRKSMQYIIFI